MNGGNPTSGVPAEVVAKDGYAGYPWTPSPTQTRGFAYDFGRNRSTNGVIEYKSDTFGGASRLLVVEYSGGDDILASPQVLTATFPVGM